VLVNLDGEPPEGGEAFERIIEIVSVEGEERRRARSRWRTYESRGWTLRHHPQAAV
jgi:DNA polymerase-3 subunit chi